MQGNVCRLHELAICKERSAAVQNILIDSNVNGTNKNSITPMIIFNYINENSLIPMTIFNYINKNSLIPMIIFNGINENNIISKIIFNCLNENVLQIYLQPI